MLGVEKDEEGLCAKVTPPLCESNSKDPNLTDNTYRCSDGGVLTKGKEGSKKLRKQHLLLH